MTQEPKQPTVDERYDRMRTLLQQVKMQRLAEKGVGIERCLERAREVDRCLDDLRQMRAIIIGNEEI